MPASSLGMPAARSRQPQTALGSSALPSLSETTSRAHAQQSHRPSASRQPNTHTQAAVHMRKSPVLEQPFSRLHYEAAPLSSVTGMAGLQSRKHCTSLPAGPGQQYPERVTRSSWPQWGAQLSSDPSTAPPRPGTSGHTGQPAPAHGPPSQPAQGQGYMQLPLVSTRSVSGASPGASASVQQPEQARTPFSQGLTGRRPHQSTFASAELANASSTRERMALAQQPAGAVAAPDLAPQHVQRGAFLGAAPAPGRPVRAPQSSTQTRPGCGQQGISPVIWPALPAGDIRRFGFAFTMLGAPHLVSLHLSDHTTGY